MAKNKIPKAPSASKMGFEVEMGSDWTFHVYRKGRLNPLFVLPASTKDSDIDNALLAQHIVDLNNQIKELKGQIKDLTS